MWRKSAWKVWRSRAGTQSFIVVYQDFLVSSDDTITAVMEYLSVSEPHSIDPSRRKLRRQSDATNDEWVRRYLKEKQSAEWEV